MSLRLDQGVPMDDSFADQGNEAVHDLLEEFDCLLLGDVVVDLEVLFEVALAEFLDDVVVVGALHDFVDGNDVFRFHLLQDLYFLQEGMFEVLV
jgi:hypothetical protein